MKKLFPNISETTAHLLKCCILLGIALLLVLAPIPFVKNDLPDAPATYVAEKDFTIYSEFDTDTVTTRVRAGETLKVYGYSPSTSTRVHPSLWVETATGVRGFLRVIDTNYPIVADNKDTGTLDTVVVKGVAEDTSFPKYACAFPDGKVEELDFDEIRPLLPEAFLENIMTNNSNVYLSLQKFEKRYLGNTFEENDSKFRPAVSVAVKDGLMRAIYPIRVTDFKTGKRYKPIVTYDITGKAISYTLDRVSSNSSWLVRSYPGLRFIMDNPLVGLVIEGSMFHEFSWLYTDEVGKSWKDKSVIFLVGILILLPCLLWLYLPSMIPTLLIGALLHKREVFRGIGNTKMMLILLLVTLISTYLWAGMMIAWGMLDIFALIFLYVVYKTYFMVFKIFEHRCYVCGSLDTYDYVSKEIVRQYKDWRKYATVRDTLAKSEKKWKTWTNTKYTYSDGSTRIFDHDHKLHVETTTTKLYDDYEIYYLITEEKHTYKCNVCGEEKYYDNTDFKELDRRDTGQHTETHTTTKTTDTIS